MFSFQSSKPDPLEPRTGGNVCEVDAVKFLGIHHGSEWKDPARTATLRAQADRMVAEALQFHTLHKPQLERALECSLNFETNIEVLNSNIRDKNRKAVDHANLSMMILGQWPGMVEPFDPMTLISGRAHNVQVPGGRGCVAELMLSYSSDIRPVLKWETKQRIGAGNVPEWGSDVVDGRGYFVRCEGDLNPLRDVHGSNLEEGVVIVVVSSDASLEFMARRRGLLFMKTSA